MFRVILFINFAGNIISSQESLSVYQIRSIEERLQTQEDVHHREIADLKNTYHSEIADLKDMYHREIADLKDTYHREIAGLKDTHERQLSELKNTYQTKVTELETETGDMKMLFSDHSKPSGEYKGSESPVGCKKGISKLSRRMDKIEQVYTSIEMNRSRRLLVGNHGNIPSKVAFYASLAASHPSTGYRQPIKFEKVVTNVGNGYNPTDGIFVAPVSGVYVFFWNILNNHNSDIHTTLASTQGWLGNTFTGKAVGLSNEGSGLVVSHLNEGAHVWVEKVETYGDFLLLFSSFSGFLLYPDV